MALAPDPNRELPVRTAMKNPVSEPLRPKSKPGERDSEGFDKAYDQTYGSGAFRISCNGSDSFGGDPQFTTGTSPNYSGYGGYGYEEEQEHRQEAAFQAFEEAFMDDPADIFYEDNSWEQFDWDTQSGPYGDVTCSVFDYDGEYDGQQVDFYAPGAESYIMNANVVHAIDGTVEYVDAGNECLAPDYGRGEQIIEAQNALADGASMADLQREQVNRASAPGQEVFLATGPASGLSSTAQGSDFAQAGDLFIATQFKPTAPVVTQVAQPNGPVANEPAVDPAFQPLSVSPTDPDLTTFLASRPQAAPAATPAATPANKPQFDLAVGL